MSKKNIIGKDVITKQLIADVCFAFYGDIEQIRKPKGYGTIAIKFTNKHHWNIALSQIELSRSQFFKQFDVINQEEIIENDVYDEELDILFTYAGFYALHEYLVEHHFVDETTVDADSVCIEELKDVTDDDFDYDAEGGELYDDEFYDDEYYDDEYYDDDDPDPHTYTSDNTFPDKEVVYSLHDLHKADRFPSIQKVLLSYDDDPDGYEHCADEDTVSVRWSDGSVFAAANPNKGSWTNLNNMEHMVLDTIVQKFMGLDSLNTLLYDIRHGSNITKYNRQSKLSRAEYRTFMYLVADLLKYNKSHDMKIQFMKVRRTTGHLIINFSKYEYAKTALECFDYTLTSPIPSSGHMIIAKTTRKESNPRCFGTYHFNADMSVTLLISAHNIDWFITKLDSHKETVHNALVRSRKQNLTKSVKRREDIQKDCENCLAINASFIESLEKVIAEHGIDSVRKYLDTLEAEKNGK